MRPTNLKGMGRPFGDWLSGASLPDSATGRGEYPGERLGLPSSGSGSIAGMFRRIVAMMVDWMIAYGLAGLLVTLGVISREQLLFSPLGPWLIMGIWLVLGMLSVRLYGFTPGQLVLGLRVASVDNREHVGIGRAAARGVLVGLVVPALFTDSDGRGIQDRVTGTAVVRR